MDSSLSFATDIAVQTGKQLLNYFPPQSTDTSLKDDNSIVTEADLAADQFIAQAIRKDYPDDSLISEELHPYLSGEESSVWVIDPLDGTTNFSLGMPIWGVSLAHLIDGWPIVAAVYFPVFDELFTAQHAKGAYLNGERLLVQPPTPGKTISFFSCCTRTHQYYDVSIRYKTRILGSACYSICAVARSMAVIGFEATPKIWDIAASWLIVSEAKGTIETMDGSQPFPLRANIDYRTKNFPILSASNANLALKARKQINPRKRKL